MDNEQKLLVFILNSISFGINVMDVREVLKPKKLQILPKKDDILKGIIEYKEKIVPVITLDDYLGFGEREDKGRKEKRWIVVKSPEELIIEVDNVEEIISIDEREIRELPENLARLKAIFKGVCRYKDSLIYVIDISGIVDLLKKKIEVPRLIDEKK